MRSLMGLVAMASLLLAGCGDGNGKWRGKFVFYCGVEF